MGKIKSGKIKVMLHLVAMFMFLFSFEFPALEVPHSKFKKAAISKHFFLFHILSYKTFVFSKNFQQIGKVLSSDYLGAGS